MCRASITCNASATVQLTLKGQITPEIPLSASPSVGIQKATFNNTPQQRGCTFVKKAKGECQRIGEVARRLSMAPGVKMTKECVEVE